MESIPGLRDVETIPLSPYLLANSVANTTFPYGSYSILFATSTRNTGAYELALIIQSRSPNLFPGFSIPEALENKFVLYLMPI